MPRLRSSVSVGASPSPASRATAARCSSAVSVRPRPSDARPSTSQLSLSVSLMSVLAYRRTRGLCRLPVMATPTCMSRFGRSASTSSVGLSGGR
jgi:hypothetical protein